VHEGHDDLVKLVAELNRTTGAEQFNIIQRNFDVEQVAAYFAVNMVLSHWDGFFNNYFAYHDVHGTGKWTMYPWDQDKTWGFHDGIHGHEVFVDMPVTFGMKGDKPPSSRGGLAGFFGGGPVWWRPAGYFSGPLLANARFREIYLARVKEILETVYTPEAMLPLIGKLGERLEGEVRFRAEIYRSDPDEAVKELHRNLDSLREHLTRRRAFLLDQAEIKNAGKRD
jgi:spore coat protein CotH